MMVFVKYFLGVILVLFAFVISVAQATYINVTDDIFTSKIYSGVAVSVCDIDGDYFDDLIYRGEDGGLYTSLYRGAHDAYQEVNIDVDVMDGLWSLVAADVDGDGRTDIIATTSSAAILYRQSLPMKFEKEYFYTYPWLPQSSNLVDVDFDGDLDFFLCNDEGANVILVNDGSGIFQESPIIDFATVPVSDNSGSYSSVWTDVDNDNDLDLYIAKCRAGVTEPTDPRRVNTLYINNGDGSYTESAAAYGVDDGLQSWSVDAGDVDNDGDMDLFVTNHDGPHRLYLNDGDTFVDYEYVPGRLESFAFQGVLADMDNNGWLDIVISDGSSNFILYNDAMDFEIDSWHPPGNLPGSTLVSDLNNDGQLDIWAQHIGGGFTGGLSNLANDQIWQNTGTTDSWVTFTLVLDEGSTLAGTRAVLTTTNGATLTRELHLGSSYGQQASTKFHFGLGGASSTQLSVKWPSGDEEFFDLSALDDNTHYLVSSSGCIAPVEPPPLPANTVLCDGDTVAMMSQAGTDVQWAGGIDTVATSIAVANYDSYNYNYRDIAGCLRISDYASMIEESALYGEVLPYATEIYRCQGQEVVLRAVPASGHLWSDGSAADSLIVTDSGTYFVQVLGECGTQYVSDTIVVDIQQVRSPILTGDTVDIGQSATLLSDTSSTRWYDSLLGVDVLAVGDTLLTEPLAADSYYYGELSTEAYNTIGRLGLATIPTSSQYTNNGLSEGVLFDVYETVVIRSVLVETDTTAVRRVVVHGIGQQSDSVYYSKDILIETGQSRIQLDAELPPGSYVMRTDASVNVANLGYRSPRLARTQSTTLLDYPFSLGDAVTIHATTTGNTRYLYFYDWEVSYNYRQCASPRTEVLAKVEAVATTQEVSAIPTIYPNPSAGAFTISSELPMLYIEVTDAYGQVHQRLALEDSTEADIVVRVHSGTYWLVVQHSSGLRSVAKIVIIK